MTTEDRLAYRFFCVTVVEAFGAGENIWLFGSRTDDSKRKRNINI